LLLFISIKSITPVSFCLPKSQPPHKSPGRPKDVQKEEAILAAAVALFLQKGYQQTTMADVARQAKVSKQTVYSHFGSKEALLEQMIRSQVEQYFLRLPLPEEDSFIAHLEALALGFLHLILDPETLAMQRLIIAEAKNQPELGQLFYDNGPRPVIEKMCALLEAQCEQLPAMQESAEAAMDFFNLIKGGEHFFQLIGVTNSPFLTTTCVNNETAYVKRAVEKFLRLYQGKGAA
jgi:TetR/AcrR family transcriptional repressor of mexJK operon